MPNEAVDHLYGFVAFITTRDQSVTVGATSTVYCIMELLKQYLESNELGDPSPGYPSTFVMPAGDLSNARR